MHVLMPLLVVNFAVQPKTCPIRNVPRLQPQHKALTVSCLPHMDLYDKQGHHEQHESQHNPTKP